MNNQNEFNYQNEVPQRKNNSSTIVIIFLVAIVCILSTFFVTKYIILNEKEKEPTKENNQNNNEEESTIKKIDSTKPYVYSKEEYKINTEGLLEGDYWIKTPVININSPDVKTINVTLEEQALQSKNSIKYSTITGKNQINYFETDSYDYYNNGDVLSLVVTHNNIMLFTGGNAPTYKVYNINLKTGKVLTNEELLSYKSTNYTEVLTKVKNELSLLGILECSQTEQCYEPFVIDSNTKMYLDNNNRINVAVYTSAPMGKGNIFVEVK